MRRDLGQVTSEGMSRPGRGPDRPLLQRARAQARRIARTVRTIIGAPDYERYVDHTRHCHPDRVPLTREEFARQRLEDRYSQPGNRCC
jgi:uncharacterized short protein YbdD (DUF466 family)